MPIVVVCGVCMGGGLVYGEDHLDGVMCTSACFEYRNMIHPDSVRWGGEQLWSPHLKYSQVNGEESYGLI